MHHRLALFLTCVLLAPTGAEQAHAHALTQKPGAPPRQIETLPARPPSSSPPKLEAHGWYAAQPLASPPSSSPLDVPLSWFHRTVLTALDGLPSSNISSMAQTPDGFLWFGSPEGLIRYDGVRFDDSFSTLLPSRNVFSLHADANGDLWVGLTFGGISRLRDGHVHNYAIQKIARGTVFAIERGPDGRLYAALGSGLLVLDGDRWERVGSTSGFGTRPPSWMGMRAGALWVLSDQVGYVMRPGSTRFERVDGALPAWVLLGLPEGVEPPVGPDFAGTATLTDSSGALWAGGQTTDSLITIDRYRLIDTPQGRGWQKESVLAPWGRQQALNQTFVDREDNVWINTTQDLEKFSRTKFAPAPLPRTIIRPALASRRKGGVWIGSLGQGVHIADGSGVSTLEPSGLVACVFESPSGAVWSVDDDHVRRIAGGPPMELPLPPGADNDGSRCQNLAGDLADGLWLSMARHGLFEYRDGAWIAYGGRHDLPAGPAIRVIEDAQQRIWFTYPGNRIAMLDRGELTRYDAADGLDVGNVLVVSARGGHVWVGGEQGVAFLAGGHFHRLQATGADAFDSVSGIVETADGALWLRAPKGVYHIPRQDIARALADPGQAVSFERFDMADGIPGGMMASVRPGPSMVQSSDGRLWVASTTGVAWIDPQHILRNTVAPNAVIVAMDADGRMVDTSSAPRLPPLTRRLRIDYTAPSLTRPDRVHFRYRLLGVDEGWQDAGTRRTATYTNLGPGNYRFEVMAINEDGLASETAGILAFAIAPAYYQTTAFRLACLLLACLIGALLVREYVRRSNNRLRARLQERHNERERIARELHDTLLQGVHGLLLRLKVIQRQIPEQDGSRAQLGAEMDRVRKVLVEGRDRVRDLRDSSGSRLDLAGSLSELGTAWSRQYGVAFQVAVQGSRPLDPVVNDEAYLIGREALLNAFRHARAHAVQVEIEHAQDHLRVSISDDGVGIDPAILESGQSPGHWGLVGMRERAEGIGGGLEIRSPSGRGTVVEIAVPAAKAYRRTHWLRWPWQRPPATTTPK